MEFRNIDEIFSYFNIELSQLPDDLQRLVLKLEKATKALSEMDDETKKQFFPVLIQTVEIVHQEVKALNFLPSVPQGSKINKQKQLELEERAKQILLRKQNRK